MKLGTEPGPFTAAAYEGGRGGAEVGTSGGFLKFIPNGVVADGLSFLASVAKNGFAAPV